MTRQEFAQVAANIQRRWYARPIPPSALDQMFVDLQDLPLAHVAAAVDTLGRDGREFPPHGGVIRRRVAELVLDAPPWHEVKGMLKPPLVTEAWECPEDPPCQDGWRPAGDGVERCPCGEARLEWVRGQDKRPDVVKDFALLLSPVEVDHVHVDRTVEAQTREKWQAFSSRRLADLLYGDLAEVEDLPGIARARRSEPRGIAGALEQEMAQLNPGD